MTTVASGTPRPHVGWAIAWTVGMVAFMASLRLHVYPHTVVPLTYALPLLLTVWHRNRTLHWGMAGCFLVMAAYKMLWVLPGEPQHATGTQLTFLAMQWANILIAAGAIHTIVVLGERLQQTNAALALSNAELTASNEELAAREEEIAQQNEELQVQNEELEQQTEELRQHGEELQTINEELAQREELLQALLRLTATTGGEEALLGEVCTIAADLLGPDAVAAAVVQRDGDRLMVRAHAGFGPAGPWAEGLRWEESLAALVVEKGQVGQLPDTALRPDLVLPRPLNGVPFRSAISAPMSVEDQPPAALNVYGRQPREWNSWEARQLEWLAAACAQAWQVTRLRAQADANAALLESIFRNVPEGITLAEAPDARILAVSPYGCELIDRAPEEITNIPAAAHPAAWRVFHTDGATLARPEELPLTRAVHGEQVRDEEWIVERADGQKIWLLCNAGPICDAAGRVTGGVIAWRDITAIKRTEAALRDRERELETLNETLERRVRQRTAEAHRSARQLRVLAAQLTTAEQQERRRLAQVLHDDLQQLLVAAKMRLGMRKGATEEGRREVAELLDQAINLSRNLTTELSPPILFQERFAGAVGWLARRYEQQHGLTVALDVQTDAEPADESWRIFLFNAVGECLFNVVKHAGVSAAVVRLTCVEDQLHIVIEDRGPGFDVEAALARAESGESFGLFSLFQRSILLGGDARIESCPGEGTRIELVAPAGRWPADPRAGGQIVRVLLPPRPDGAPAGRIRIVLVDDHEVLREGLRVLLNAQADLEVVAEAGNGREALALARRHRPDAVVMDVTMPELDGVETTRILAAELPETQVIALTMHESEEMAAAMRAAGAAAYLPKGNSAERLIHAIRQAGRRAAEPTP